MAPPWAIFFWARVARRSAAARLAPASFGLVRIRHKAPEGDRAVENTFAMAGVPAASFEADFRARIQFVSQTGCTLSGQMDGIRPYAVPAATPDPTR